jgi:outer membrane protein
MRRIRRFRQRTTTLLAILFLAAPGGAQPQPSDPGLPVASSQTLHGELAISLEEALGMAIENNLNVEIVRHDPLIATEQAIAAWGSYDPRVASEANWARNQTPVASELQGGLSLIEEDELYGFGGIRGLVPMLGWSYEIGYNGQRLESNSAIQSLSPEYRSGLTGSIVLPVLKGFLWGEAWIQVKTTQVFEDQSYEEFRLRLMDTITAVEGSYWDVIATRQQLKVANKSVETAAALLDQTKAQYEVGVVSKVEVVEAEAGVADRDFNRIVAENLYLRAQDTLIDLVLGPHLTPDSRLELRPTTEPDVVDYQIDSDAAAAKAFEHRPELSIAEFVVENQELNLKFAKNQRLPQLDVVGSYGYAGLAGTTNPAPGFGDGPREPIPIHDRYSDSHSNYFSDSGARSWSAGAVLSFPIGKIRERADVRRARLEIRRANTQVRRVEQDIILEVRDAVRNLQSSIEGIEASKQNMESAQEQLRAEQIRLEHGESTPFEVLQREEDLVQAESRHINSLQAYRNSVTALDRRQGTILRDRGIVVDDALTLR